MAAENIMERPHPETPHFTSPEERENIEFYKGWVETAFTGELHGVATMARLRDSLTLSSDDLETAHFFGVDLSSVQTALAEIKQQFTKKCLMQLPTSSIPFSITASSASVFIRAATSWWSRAFCRKVSASCL